MGRRFESKVVIVTGGPLGLRSRRRPLLSASEGAKVVISGRRVKEGEEAAAAIRQAGGRRSSSGPMCPRKRTWQPW